MFSHNATAIAAIRPAVVTPPADHAKRGSADPTVYDLETGVRDAAAARLIPDDLAEESRAPLAEGRGGEQRRSFTLILYG